MSQPTSDPELQPDDALAVLSQISDSLVESYQELATRAEHVEQELCRTNIELEQKITELNAVTSHLEAILQALPTGVVVRDSDGRIVRLNGAALQILGAEGPEVEGEAARFAVPEASEQVTEKTLTLPDGSRRVVATASSPIESNRGPIGSVQILDDRTELARLSQRLHRVDKIAALGNVAAGIAHEIRNPMNAIKGFAGLLRSGLEAETKPHRWANKIVEGVEEVDAIVTSMLSFARPEGLHRETISAKEVVAEAVTAASVGAAWSVEANVAPLTFVGDRIKLRHALRNLISNAQNAQTDGGRVKVSVESNGHEVTFTVDDAGPGISPELRARIFDPFFTTRAQGTGLGLSLVTTIAELHGGHIEVSEQPSPLSGARVVLTIPFESPESKTNATPHTAA